LLKCYILKDMIVNVSFLAGEDMGLVEEGFICVEDGFIRELGEGFEGGGVDYRDYLVVPGFFNSHVHLGDSFALEGVVGLGVRSAVGPGGRKWVLYEGVSEYLVLDGVRGSLEYMKKLGTTFFADFQEGGKKGINMLQAACESTPLKKKILGRDIKIDTADGLGLNVYNLEQIPQDRGDKIIAVHAGEEEGEITLALDYKPNIIVHATCASDEEIDRLAESKTDVVVCPRANAALKVGFPPIRKLIDAGVRVSLGTDNIMINSPNIFREMEYLLKYSQINEPLTPLEVLQAATVNAAETYNINSGVIEEGRAADLVYLDKSSVSLRHSRDILASVVSRCSPSDISKIMVDGVYVINKNG